MSNELRTYFEAIDYLNNNFPFFTVMVTSLGNPIMDSRIPTLMVRRMRGSEDFELAINPNVFAMFQPSERAALLAHEAFHIMLDHLDEQTTQNCDDTDKVILAQECIVNDNVINERFDLPYQPVLDDQGEMTWSGLYTGPKVVERSVAYYSTDEVCALISDDNPDYQNMKDQNQQGNPHFQILSQEEMEKLQKKITKDIQYAVNMGEIDPSDVKSDDLKNALRINGFMSKAGASGSKVQRDLAKQNISMEWLKLIRTLDPTAYRDGGSLGDYKTSWKRPRKKLAHMYPQVNLPISEPRWSPLSVGGLKPSLVIAMDHSGSIPEALRAIMENLARAIPRTINISCCTFADEFEPYDHKLDGSQTVAEGGTNFSAIVQYVNSLKLTNKPNVVVLTDGEATFRREFPGQKVLDRKWKWLLINKKNTVHDPRVTKGVEYLDDYLLKKGW